MSVSRRVRNTYNCEPEHLNRSPILSATLKTHLAFCQSLENRHVAKPRIVPKAVPMLICEGAAGILEAVGRWG